MPASSLKIKKCVSVPSREKKVLMALKVQFQEYKEHFGKKLNGLLSVHMSSLNLIFF